ncbi:MAG: cobyric acid synthase CobQ [Deltaproteobacteria bacterium]|jgi:adenosylcobyric acid synthase|nr:cobyric acid synthase CobQ [Deltaproteobacteria bacterium]
MILGTGSGVGKSLLTAGLCRLVHRAGVRVAPFKPQNMSNNAAACAGGGEIGRAQALQALACGLEPQVDMNPVLIKPEGDRQAQLIVLGQPRGTLWASRFREDRVGLLPEVTAAFERLRSDFDFVWVEGAGSPAEPNLRLGDIANLGFAEAVDIDAWLIGDIDRGGVFAALLGSLAALDERDRRRIRAFIINRFRGDLDLLGGALDWLEARCELPVLGVVPQIPDLCLPEEDAPYASRDWRAPDAPRARVVAVQYPTASNLSDLDALSLVPDLEVQIVRHPENLSGADLVVLPGSKAVRRDLEWLRTEGFVPVLERHLRYGGRLLGICGGLQMLGIGIDDPTGLEGGGSSSGLGWLPVRTELLAAKRVSPVELAVSWPEPLTVIGYEIHHGVTTRSRAEPPFHAASEDGQVSGTYVHGLFDHAPYRDALLKAWFGDGSHGSEDLALRWQRDLDRLADVLAGSLDLAALETRLGVALT